MPDENKQTKSKKKIMKLDFNKEEKVMEEDKVKNVINIIKDMNIKDKLRLAICMNDSQWLTLNYNRKEMYNKFDTHLRKIDEEYRTTLINFGQSKYFIINFTMAKLMEMEQTDRNKIALYLFNSMPMLI